MQRIPRTHDITYFLDLHERGHLDLNPPYQRRSVWTRTDREYFIDTVLHNYPSPAIFIHRTIDDDGKAVYHVVDGKQRLETIIDFSKGKVRIPRNFGDDRLNGKKWDDLTPQEKRAFWDYSISVEFLPLVDDAVVNSVFERINRNSRKLTPQELRHAKYDGWFAGFVESQADDDDWKEMGVVTNARARRMGDVQFLAELLIVIIRSDIVGFDQDVIDAHYAEFADPDEAAMPLTTDEVASRFGKAKSFIRDMCAIDPAVKTPLKTLANFYSLWAFVALNPDRAVDPSALAIKYLAFMNRVAEFQRNPLRQLAEAGPDMDVELAANIYAINVLGASTDEKPRRDRARALTRGLELVP
jgi:hypothetical protein